jgi:hypothetical protein
MTLTGRDELHLAMGEFLTECANLENLMMANEHRDSIDSIISDLNGLLPRRNLIVHGMTYEVAFGGGETKAYRIGVPKGNIDYLRAPRTIAVLSSNLPAPHCDGHFCS